LNQIAMKLLNQEKFKLSFKIFKQLLRVLKGVTGTESSQVLTYNNLACCYKRWGKVREA